MAVLNNEHLLLPSCLIRLKWINTTLKNSAGVATISFSNIFASIPLSNFCWFFQIIPPTNKTHSANDQLKWEHLKIFQCNESFEKEIQMELLVYCKHEHVLTTSLLLKAKYVAVHFLRYNCAFNFNYRYKTNVNILLSCKSGNWNKCK